MCFFTAKTNFAVKYFICLQISKKRKNYFYELSILSLIMKFLIGYKVSCL